MALINSKNLAEMLRNKAEWSARDLILEDLDALEAETASDPVEVPSDYDIDDVVTALVTLGLLTVAS